MNGHWETSSGRVGLAPQAWGFLAGAITAAISTIVLVASTRGTGGGSGADALSLPAFLGATVVMLVGLSCIILLADRSYRAGRHTPLSDADSRLTDPVAGLQAPFLRASIDGESALRLEQTAHIFRQLDLMLALNVINALLVALAIFSSVDGRLLAVWLMLMAISIAIGRRSRFRTSDQAAEAIATKRTMRRLSLQAGMRGLTWGLSFALFFDSADGTGRLVLLGVVLGMVAGGVPSLASIPSAALMFGLGVMVPTLLRLVSIGTLDSSILTLLGLTFCGSMVIIAEQLYRNFATNMTTRQAQAEQAATISLLLNDYETSSSDWLWETDKDGRLVRFPQRMAELFGSDSHSDVAPTLAAVLAGRQGHGAEILLEHMDKPRPFRGLQLEATGADGTSRWISLTASPKPDGGWRGVGSDITAEVAAKRAAADALARAEKAEQRLRDGIDSLGAGFILTDAADRTICANRQFYDTMSVAPLLGSAPTFEEIARSQASLWPQPDTTAAHVWLADLLEKRGTTDVPFDSRLPDGHWLRVKSARTTEGGTVTVLTDITDIKQQEAILADQTKQLASSNNELVQFATVASHDLQEPLRKIEAFGARLKTRSGNSLDNECQHYLERMMASTQRMRRLITDLLAYSRVGRRETEMATVDLDKLLTEVMDDLSVAIGERNAVVRAQKLGLMRGEAILLRQLFQNLLANALKFSKPGEAPEIEIERMDSAAGSFELRFRDNGIGFDMQNHDRIFEIFQRLHGREEFEGTGVGLATCRKIVERHGGKLTALSTPGKGSTFIAKLPTCGAQDQLRTKDAA